MIGPAELEDIRLDLEAEELERKAAAVATGAIPMSEDATACVGKNSTPADSAATDSGYNFPCTIAFRTWF